MERFFYIISGFAVPPTRLSRIVCEQEEDRAGVTSLRTQLGVDLFPTISDSNRNRRTDTVVPSASRRVDRMIKGNSIYYLLSFQ